MDAFSIGVVLYCALVGYEPFYGVNEKQLIAANKAVSYEFHLPEWSAVSFGARDLVSQLLEKDLAQRLTPQQALQHSWLLSMQHQQAEEDPTTDDTATLQQTVLKHNHSTSSSSNSSGCSVM